MKTRKVSFQDFDIFFWFATFWEVYSRVIEQKIEAERYRLHSRKLGMKFLQDYENVLNQAESLDLCFCLDITGSMQKYIDQVKNDIIDIARGMTDQFENFKVRFAFVGYRDW